MPAAAASRHLADADGGFGPARELAAWKQRVVRAWPQLRIEHVEAEAAGQALGSALTVRVSVALGPLTPDDVMVEVVYGRPDDADEIVSPGYAALAAEEYFPGETTLPGRSCSRGSCSARGTFLGGAGAVLR